MRVDTAPCIGSRWLVDRARARRVRGTAPVRIEDATFRCPEMDQGVPPAGAGCSRVMRNLALAARHGSPGGSRRRRYGQGDGPQKEQESEGSSVLGEAGHREGLLSRSRLDAVHREPRRCLAGGVWSLARLRHQILRTAQDGNSSPAVHNRCRPSTIDAVHAQPLPAAHNGCRSSTAVAAHTQSLPFDGTHCRSSAVVAVRRQSLSTVGNRYRSSAIVVDRRHSSPTGSSALARSARP